MLRILLTDDEVDLRPRKPADDLRYEECGVSGDGLRLGRGGAIRPLPVDPPVETRGRLDGVGVVRWSEDLAITVLFRCVFTVLLRRIPSGVWRR